MTKIKLNDIDFIKIKILLYLTNKVGFNQFVNILHYTRVNLLCKNSINLGFSNFHFKIQIKKLSKN